MSGDGLDTFIGGKGDDTITIADEVTEEPEIDAGPGDDTVNIQSCYGAVRYGFNMGDGIDHVQSSTPWSGDHALIVSGDIDWAVFDIHIDVTSAQYTQGTSEGGNWRLLANARIDFGNGDELLIDNIVFFAEASAGMFNPSTVSYLVTDGFSLGFNGPELIQSFDPQFDGQLFWI